ncbi:TerD family protein [Streptacidiphilus rugosus]|uniref:TerD family protein n=1 Tax=Streptacidiphilus rugosus TaxID=405783 RepID=UPI00055D3EF8|nr:TerD family protein [Streptacidiphilus rugosus]
MSVSLGKGQSVSLEKAAGGGSLAVVRMGLGWQAAPRKGLFRTRRREIDLDASAVLFTADALADVVFFQHLVSNDGSVRHTGDNLVGGSGGEDDESIMVDLRKVPQKITQIVFTVNSYSGQTFQEVELAHCRLVDESTGTELARYTLSGGGAHTGQVMAKVYRDAGGGWQMAAIGVPAQGRTFQDMLPAIQQCL